MLALNSGAEKIGPDFSVGYRELRPTFYRAEIVPKTLCGDKDSDFVVFRIAGVDGESI
jgi:hypothetical protein